MPVSWSRIVVEEDHGVIEVHEGGRMMPGLNVAMSNDDVERTRQGYKCIHCWEPFETAWPKNCRVCGFPVAERQAEHFERVYAGYDPTLRTGADWEAEADRLDDIRERREFEERAARSGISLGLRGISIPKSLKRKS